MEIEIKIDSGYKIPKAVILTDRVTEEVSALVARLSENPAQVISGFRDNVLTVLEQGEIIRIYSADGRVFAVTDKGEFTLRRRLYEMEEQLDGARFVRISNSEIINLRRVKCFDLNLAGTVRVTMCNTDVTYVSRRYVSKIKRILGV